MLGNEVEEQIDRLKELASIRHVQNLRPFCYKVIYCPQKTNSPYSSINFSLKLTLTEKYPEHPPHLYFLDKIYHLNVDSTTGEVCMPILKQDWSPYLSLSAVFQSLDALMEQPEPNYAANKLIHDQFIYTPQIYAQKVEKMLKFSEKNISQHMLNDNLNGEEEEVIEFEEIIELNNTSKQQIHIRQENADSPDTVIPNHQNSQSNNLEQSIILSKQNNVKPIGNGLKYQNVNPRETVNMNPKEAVDRSLRQLKNSLEVSPVRQIDDIKYNDMAQSLKKANELIAIFISSCQSLESHLKDIHSERIKALVKDKLQNEWSKLEELLSISNSLEEKLMSRIKQQMKAFSK